jgi:hypothetical protein
VCVCVCVCVFEAHDEIEYPPRNKKCVRECVCVRVCLVWCGGGGGGGVRVCEDMKITQYTILITKKTKHKHGRKDTRTHTC